MDYLISPFGFPPVGYELPKEIDDQISTKNINAAYKEVYDLLQKVCEQNLWRNQFQDQNHVEQTRFFSTAKYYYLSGFQIRGLAELHLALKYHIDTSVKLEESRNGYSCTYCFDLQTRIDATEQTKIVSSAKEPALCRISSIEGGRYYHQAILPHLLPHRAAFRRHCGYFPQSIL